MKRKLIISMLTAAMAFSVVPTAYVTAKTTTTTVIEEDEEEEEDSDSDDDYGLDDEDDGDDEWAGELTKGDIRTTPSKKTIKIGKSFYINVIPADDTEWEDLPDEEWEELCEENIDNISFRSTKSSVASVNKTTGRVKGKRKGSAVIKATIDLANGDSAVYKTKVYVTR